MVNEMMSTADLTALCATCGHKKHPDGGWCYMFRTPPTTACLKHTAVNGMVNIFQIIGTMEKVRAEATGRMPDEHR